MYKIMALHLVLCMVGRKGARSGGSQEGEDIYWPSPRSTCTLAIASGNDPKDRHLINWQLLSRPKSTEWLFVREGVGNGAIEHWGAARRWAPSPVNASGMKAHLLQVLFEKRELGRYLYTVWH
jgi:hypothetical protein